MTTPEALRAARPHAPSLRDDAGPFDLAALARLDAALHALTSGRERTS